MIRAIVKWLQSPLDAFARAVFTFTLLLTGSTRLMQLYARKIDSPFLFWLNNAIFVFICLRLLFVYVASQSYRQRTKCRRGIHIPPYDTNKSSGYSLEYCRDCGAQVSWKNREKRTAGFGAQQ